MQLRLLLTSYYAIHTSLCLHGIIHSVFLYIAYDVRLDLSRTAAVAGPVICGGGNWEKVYGDGAEGVCCVY